MERTLRPVKEAAACALLCALLVLAGCPLELFDAVKQEVEDYQAAQAGSPEIVVLKGIVEVPDGGEVPIGTAIAGESKQVTFSIESAGDGSLRLTGSPRVQISGTHADQFAVYSLPASVIAAGGKSDLIIEFSPTGVGDRTATLTIENNASGDGTFEFNIVGVGVGAAGPEIQVTTGSTIIDENPGYTRDFGKLFSGSSSEATFTIYNVGTNGSELELFGSPIVQIGGADPGMFSVTVSPDKTSLWQGDPAQDHTSFELSYHPTVLGTHTATVTIPNDDGDESPYIFYITGTCYQLDVLFLLGANGSMGSVLTSAKTGIAETMNALKALDGNAAFALATFVDFPYSPWGSAPDEAYILRESLTVNPGSIVAALDPLFAYGGLDPEASQLEALYQGTTGEGLSLSDPFSYTIPANPVGWRPSALHVIVLITDSAFHDPEQEPPYPGHTFARTMEAMGTAQVEMIGMSVGAGRGLQDMQTLAEGTGGTLYSESYYYTPVVMQGIYALMSQY